MKSALPWLLAVLAVLAVFPVSRMATRAERQEEQKEEGEKALAPEPPAAEDQEKEEESPPPPWTEPVRLLRELFGLPPVLEMPREQQQAELVAAAKKAGYSLEFLVALVPDPVDSRLPANFDRAVDAIQSGYAQSDYLLDRAWLPWSDDEAKTAAAHRAAPGLMLFRRKVRPGDWRLGVVLLVGETPKSGIHKAAFREALDLVAGLSAGKPQAVRLLGPSFSGSAESLRLAMLDRPGSLAFRAATGTATARGLEDLFRRLGVGFCRTVVPDEILQRNVFTFLREEMAWDLRQVALLTESDTAYGRSLLRGQGRQREEDPLKDLISVQVPSNLFDLRNAAGEPVRQDDASEALEELLRPSRPALDLRLTDRDAPRDLVPTFDDSLTTRSKDLKLANLLEAVSREGIRYVGVLQTDVKDKLFLAAAIRRFVPDTVLFTFDNDLLYAHPQLDRTMDETLVFSSAPLFTEGELWVPSALDPQGRQRRQLTSELEQGIFLAVRHLLEPDQPLPRPDAWITAVGNGSLWPIARVPVSDGGWARLCGAEPQPAKRSMRAGGRGLADRIDLQILLVALALVLLAVRLRRVALLAQVPGAPAGLAAANRRLLAAGSLLLALAAGFLAALGSLPFASLDLRQVFSLQAIYLVALVLVYAALVRGVARAFQDRVGPVAGIAWALAGGLVLVALALALRHLWIPGGQIAFFYLRARAFASGLSPLVTLAALGGAVYSWLYFELERRRLMARQATDCPLEALDEPAVAGCGGILAAIRSLLTRTLPEDLRLWGLPAVAFLPPLFLLVPTFQPIGETAAFGLWVLAFLVVALALAALSFYRFLRLWHWTRRLLLRLDEASPALAEAFEEVAQEMRWRPMKSFGLRMPPFRTPVLSVRRLRALAALGRVSLEPGALDRPFLGVFTHSTQGLAAEVASRNELEAALAAACESLKGKAGQPGVREFLALRIAAYLRYIFAHLRNCLLGALASGFLVLVAVTAYAFQPKQFIALAVWLALAAAVLLTLWVFVQMDRNATLSRIGGTPPGQVSFDRTFYTNLFTYVGIPLLGLLATRFPGVAGSLSGLAQQLLRVSGGG